MKMNVNAFSSSLRLFTPYRLGPYSLPSRVIMAPMTRNRAGEDGVPSARTITYYAQRASAALIITEATNVLPQSVGYPYTPGIYESKQIEGWRPIVTAVQRLGSRIFLQLYHAGRISHPSLQPDAALPVAPSAIAPEGEAFTYTGRLPFVTPRALTIDEIQRVVNAFRGAAGNAWLAGFDGVELHAANGYLLDQFLRDGTNKRADEYGGTLSKRLRLLGEVVQGVVDVWGAGRVGVRLSPLSRFNTMFDSNPEATFTAAVEMLNEFPLAYLHIVEQNDAPAAGPAFDVNRLRDLSRHTYVVNGDYDRDRAEAALAEGRTDLVSFGRLFVANPDLPLRFAKGQSLNEPDQTSFYGGDDRGYIDYPFAAAPPDDMTRTILRAGGPVVAEVQQTV